MLFTSSFSHFQLGFFFFLKKSFFVWVVKTRLFHKGSIDLDMQNPEYCIISCIYKFLDYSVQVCLKKKYLYTNGRSL